MTESMTINIAPDRHETARIIAYVFASHLELAPREVVGGDYWNFTDHEERLLFTAYELVDAIDKAMLAIGKGVYELPKVSRKRIIFDAIAKARETVSA
jgi:hypothetical protein